MCTDEVCTFSEKKNFSYNWVVSLIFRRVSEVSEPLVIHVDMFSWKGNFPYLPLSNLQWTEIWAMGFYFRRRLRGENIFSLPHHWAFVDHILIFFPSTANPTLLCALLSLFIIRLVYFRKKRIRFLTYYHDSSGDHDRESTWRSSAISKKLPPCLWSDNEKKVRRDSRNNCQEVPRVLPVVSDKYFEYAKSQLNYQTPQVLTTGKNPGIQLLSNA